MASRWDELERAIRGKDSDAAERLWLELLEQDPGNVDGFLKAADGIAERAGGRRQAGVLLWMVAGALKDKGRDKDLVRLYARLAKIAPDDGTLRTALTEAVRRGYEGRSDVEALLERSGVVGGTPAELAKQAEALERYLRLEPGAYVFHKTGWGIGKIVEYQPERGRCVIDFLSKKGHGMDLLAAADLLERLPEDDLRVMAAYRRDELREMASKRPLEVLRKVLGKLGNDAPLRHVKDTLVPDVVEKTSWASWWKEAKKQALLDPAFSVVGGGTDPRITYTPGGASDFASVLVRQLSFAPAGAGRQSVYREFAKTAGSDAGARALLVQQAKTDHARTPEGDPAARLSWAVLVAELEGGDAPAALAPTFQEAKDPRALLRSLVDDGARALAARALLLARGEDGAHVLIDLALAEDIAVADVAADHFLASQRMDHLDRILDPTFADPLARPMLYGWAVRGLVRGRWPGRNAEAYKLAEQVIKVLHETAYTARRESDAKRQRAVDSLADLLAERNCRIVLDAVQGIEVEGARHLLRLLDRNQGLKPRLKEKLSDTILRKHPQALVALQGSRAEAAAETPAASQEVYMTAAGIARMKAEYERIVNQEMPANAAEIQRAREFGDLSENAEYHAAREKQGMLIARSNDLKGVLALAREIRPEIVRTDAVSVGSRVRLRDAEGREVTYTLLGPADVDVERNVINYQTPLGQSLMGKKPGDSVSLDVMGHKHAYQVLEIASGI
jgi:transcription elongation factor GreA